MAQRQFCSTVRFRGRYQGTLEFRLRAATKTEVTKSLKTQAFKLVLPLCASDLILDVTPACAA